MKYDPGLRLYVYFWIKKNMKSNDLIKINDTLLTIIEVLVFALMISF